MEEILAGRKIILLGGDKREKYLLSFLFQQGAELTVLANKTHKHQFLAKNIRVITEVDALKDIETDVIIAPMTGVDSNYCIKDTFVDYPVKITEEFLGGLTPSSKFLIGLAPEKLKEWSQKNQVDLIEMAALDQLAILNAVPTAEAAISIAVQNSPLTLHGNNSFVLGLGRVGLTMARMLSNLGSKTYGVARKYKDLARAEEMGLEAVHFKDLARKITEADFIFNTVPVTVLNKSVLEFVKDDVLIIDLASHPGGTDFEVAQNLGVDAKLALGLPGKTAPKSAGRIIADIIPRLILEN